LASGLQGYRLQDRSADKDPADARSRFQGRRRFEKGGAKETGETHCTDVLEFMAMASYGTKPLEQLLTEFAAVELRLRKLRRRSRVEYSNDVKGLIQYLKTQEVTHLFLSKGYLFNCQSSG